MKRKNIRDILFFTLCFVFVLGIIFIPNFKSDYRKIGSNKYSTAQIEGFEKSLFGATGWAAVDLSLKESPNNNSNDIATIAEGTPFIILGETGDYWQIQYGQYFGYIQHAYCMINLPDVVPSIKYNITNASASIYRSSGYDITSMSIVGDESRPEYNITGSKLYSAGKVQNDRIGRNEYIVPSLYSTAKKIAKAQVLIKQQNKSLMIYDSYRPVSVSQKVSTAFGALADSNPTVSSGISGWDRTWFIATINPGVNMSAHNVAAAIDVSLWDNQTNQEVTDMPTSMHELSKAATRCTNSTCNQLSSGMINSASAMLLSNVMTNQNVGMGTLASEWWHFQDNDGLNVMKNVTNTTGRNFQVTEILSTTGYAGKFVDVNNDGVVNDADVGDVNGDGIVNDADAELIYNTYQLLASCDTCNDLKNQADYNKDGNVNLDDVYSILNKDNDLITSSYSLGDGYIDVGNSIFNSSNITLKNVPNVSSYVSDNKYFITYHDEEIKSYDIVSYSNDDHDLSKSYLLYKGGLAQINTERASNNFSCVNCVVEYNLDNNKVYIKKNSESSNSLREYDIVYPIYEGHDLSKAYIYTGNDPLEVGNAIRDDRFTSVNSDIIRNNNKVYIIKKMDSNENVDVENMSEDDIYAIYDVVFYSSDDYVLGDSVDLNSNRVDDLLSKIRCHNCDISVYNGNNKVTSGEIPSGSKIIINENVTGNEDELENSTVNYPVSDITLTESSRILVGEEDKLYYMIIPDYSTNQNVTWESSNPSVVTVDSTGKITGISVGEATVTVTTEDGNHSASCSVIVTDQYRVTYHWSGIATRYYRYGDEVDLDYNNIIGHDYFGYEFIGWKYNNVIYNSNNKLYMPKEYVDLYAEWKLISDDINDDYTVENYENVKIIKGIHLNTSVSDFSLGLDQKYTVRVYETDNSTIKTSGYIGTGNIIKVYDGDRLVDEYTVSVLGDMNGDGEVSSTDFYELYKLRKKLSSNQIVEHVYKLAGDTNNDGSISSSDFYNIYKLRKKNNNSSGN